MKLLVLGATGSTGLEIVRQTIERGHFVTAFVRAPERLSPFFDRITVKQGNPLNSIALERIMQNHDAVLSGFGPRSPVSKEDSDLLKNFAASLTGAMVRSGVRRAVVVSTAFLFRDAILPPAHLLGRLLSPGIVRDASAMESIICESGLDWTIVRPPRLTNAPFTGRYRELVGHLPRFGFNVSRPDVADCVIKAVENRSHVRMILGMSN
jgi:putative NADH-flavin reductase